LAWTNIETDGRVSLIAPIRYAGRKCLVFFALRPAHRD